MSDQELTQETAANRAWEARGSYILPDFFYIAITATIVLLGVAWGYLKRGHVSQLPTCLIDIAFWFCIVALALFLFVTCLGFAYDRHKKPLEASNESGRDGTGRKVTLLYLAERLLTKKDKREESTEATAATAGLLNNPAPTPTSSPAASTSRILAPSASTHSGATDEHTGPLSEAAGSASTHSGATDEHKGPLSEEPAVLSQCEGDCKQKERQPCNCKPKKHQPMWLEIFPRNLRNLMLSAPGQLILSCVILLGVLRNKAPAWLQDMETYKVTSSYHTLDTLRLPGIVILAQRDNPFAAKIVDDNGPPECFWRKWNRDATCGPVDYSNPSINKTCNCSGNITSSRTFLNIRDREYDAYVFAANFSVSEVHTPALYWTRPNPGDDVSVDPPVGQDRPLVPRNRCTQSSLAVAFFDAQAIPDYATNKETLVKTIERASTLVQQVSAGQIYDIQLARRTFQARDRTKPPITVFDPIWSPSVSTGSCETAFYVSYATLMVQEASEVRKLELHELIAELGGILGFVQLAVTFGAFVLLWLVGRLAWLSLKFSSKDSHWHDRLLALSG